MSKEEMKEKEESQLVAKMSLAAGYAKIIPYFTERRFLDGENLELDLTEDKKENLCWMQISKVGKPIEKSPEYFLTALQKVLYSCSFPGQRVFFLITGGKNSDNGIFIGLESQNASEKVKTLSEFVSSVWPGTILNDTDTEKSVLLKKLSEKIKDEDIPNKIGLVTGIPSMGTQYDTIYPATVDHLIEGMSDCENYAYLVVAEPIKNDDIDNVLFQCRNLQGQMESLKNAQVSDSLSTSIMNSIGYNVSKSDKTIDLKLINNAIKKLFPQLTIDEANKYTGRAISMMPFIGNAVPTVQEGVSINGGMTSQSGKTITSNIVNKHMDAIAEHLGVHAERLESGKAIGMWKVYASLMTFNDSDFDKGKALLKSLLSGQESKYEPVRITDVSDDLDHYIKDKDGKVNIKDKDGKVNDERIKDIVKFQFPAFGLKDIEHPFGELYNNLSTLLTTKELTSFINFPLKSVSGITVREQATFGRNIVSHSETEKNLCLGHIMHLGKCSEHQKVEIDMNALTSHTFITGTTGSGKSNTLYLMLNQIIREGKNFLVVEPAKGEYKEIFGGREGVRVLGGNPEITELLRINPFMFPRGIHVYEHIDAITEIFNACWPMSAAMPVVLKRSIEEAYKASGWNLNTNKNPYNLWPTMKDVLLCLNKMINDSKYSNDTKGDYIGALETRLQSMSEGLVGQMFNSTSPISDKELFNHNVIVDLSRIRSSETKSLIMGMLILKLQEWRTVENKGMDQNFRHVTILEEAHHLLKRTSTQQSLEGANLVGKSVEMIVNGIAEMRTYGEGFIIADQSPSLLDLSVIRNTNTKIIMALPEAEDREVAGKSIGLNQEQINELSKQKRGEAVVYQNSWEEAVQCKIDLFKEDSNKEGNSDKEGYGPDKNISDSVDKPDIDVLKFLLDGRLSVKPTYSIEKVREAILVAQKSSALKYRILCAIDEYKEMKYMKLWDDKNFFELASLVAGYVGKEKETELLMRKCKSEEHLSNSMRKLCKDILLHNDSDSLNKTLSQCLLRNQIEINPELTDTYKRWFDFNIKLS